jgi:hypothetical protein
MRLPPKGSRGMATEALEARISALEQIIIIIIIRGGGVWGGGPPRGDPAATDLSRIAGVEDLLRRRGDPAATDLARIAGVEELFHRRGDPAVTDIARLSASAVDTALLDVHAELTRLQSLEGELKARQEALRGARES